MHAIVRASVSGCHSLGHLDVASANQFRRRQVVVKSFEKDFVHVEPYKEGKPQVIKGEKFDADSPESLFLDEDEKKAILARADDLVELVHVTLRRYDERGKQVGSPRDVILRRYKGGRWYIREGLVF